MRLLLDTQVFLWSLADDPRLGRATRDLIRTRENDVFVSAVSLWEIAITVSLGKLDCNVSDVRSAIPLSGFQELPLTGRHAERVANLPWHHRDPFDRMLVAQALVEPLRLVTADRGLMPYGDVVMPL